MGFFEVVYFPTDNQQMLVKGLIKNKRAPLREKNSPCFLRGCGYNKSSGTVGRKNDNLVEGKYSLTPDKPHRDLRNKNNNNTAFLDGSPAEFQGDKELQAARNRVEWKGVALDMISIQVL